MLKFILQSFLGVIVSLGAVFLFYLFIVSLNNNANYLLLISSTLLAAGGVYILLRVGKNENVYTAHAPKITSTLTGEDPESSSRLEKNNELLGEWKKTNETKDRLRMLEISASAGDSESS